MFNSNNQIKSILNETISYNNKDQNLNNQERYYSPPNQTCISHPYSQNSIQIEVNHPNYQRNFFPFILTNYSNYENYDNISQIPHEGISQPNKNTFNISTGVFSYLCPIGIFALSMTFIILGIMSLIGWEKGAILGFILFVTVGLYLFSYTVRMCYHFENKIIVDLGENSLTILKISYCSTERDIYMKGQLRTIYFDAYFNPYGDNLFSSLILIKGNGQKEVLLHSNGALNSFKREEIEYFNYFINKHIQDNMII